MNMLTGRKNPHALAVGSVKKDIKPKFGERRLLVREGRIKW